jgi:predicted ATPase/class 3 adenylate cyclase
MTSNQSPPPVSQPLPSGTVTFLFTDIEGSTKLWRDHPEAMKRSHARHNEILHQAIESNNGYVFQVVGDAFAAAFHTAGDAVKAAMQAQTELTKEAWGAAVIKVRMGIHTGEAEIKDDGQYNGYMTMSRVQRLMSAGHGGQVLVSLASEELIRDDPPENIKLRDLGEHRLKDLIRPKHIFQLVAPNLPSEFPPLKTLQSVRNNLPPALTSFIGRERELAESQEKLASARLLTLIGPGGTGKTRLSLQVASEQIGNFKDGVWLVELAPLSDAALIVSTIASVFNLREVQDIPLINTVMDYLRAKESLLLLDNCEHLVEASAKIVDQLLHECLYLKIIASSREALGINGETVYRVPSLKDDEATRLFVERATKTEPRFHLTKGNASFIAQICSRLDGIPLAIELAAARINLFSPQQIAERLDDRFKLLTGGSRTALPRQQTLRALIDWSYQTLNETEQRALRGLSVFSGGWTFEAAEAVIGESEALDGLAGLVNKSLVNVEEREGISRYSFLETIRQYALEKLLVSDEATQTRDKHFEYYFKFANQFSGQVYFERKKKWADLFELENDNLRSALNWGMEHHLLKSVQLLRCMGDFWMAKGYLTEGQEWCDSVIKQLENHLNLNAEVDLARAYAHRVMAILSNNQGRHSFAREHIEKAIPLFQGVGETKELARSLMVLTTASGFSGNMEKAFEAVHEGIRLAREAGHKFELSWGLEVLAQVTFVARGLAAEKEIDVYIQESLALLEEINHPWKTNTAKEYLARRAYIQGDIETARKYANELIADFQESGAILLAINFKSEMAHGLRQMGHLNEAYPIYCETIIAYQDFGHRGAVAHQLECFAFIAIAQEQGERAVKLLGTAEALREVSNSRMTPQERIEYEKQITSLRAGMDAGMFTSRWAEGRAMTMDAAIEYALEVTDD